ncbi:putative bacteriophage terminase large subunit-like protein [Magnetofaba australis IT-1]|uniref:Putative bacteriophage terminase large subunit-like protein n=1 Tax=Magnetofaba australis IT-1 TaxID=1434232 RepID=A0A1Y2K3Q3_9PROT|nr:putative bacteriophage terminase large subunit-like protein [Magnetofaba australis IT-1]
MHQGPQWRGVLFRRHMPELDEARHRAEQIYPKAGGVWSASHRRWTFPSGATLSLRHLENESDADRYQGHQYAWIGYDELGSWSSDGPYRKLMACLRSASGAENLRIRATGNPGGPGHQWIKARFIDPAPTGFRVFRDTDTGLPRMFIPARVDDNRILLHNDPDYVARLRGVGSKALVKAWLGGDWSAISGAYFDQWDSSRHIIEPVELPTHWTRFRAFDWGSAAPFSVGWWAVSDGSLPHIARGALVRYREWYGATGPNRGLRLTAEEVADGILEAELPGERIRYSVADPAIFATDGGPSLAERMGRRGVPFRPADNARIAGWDQIRARLKGDAEGRPLLLCFSLCADSIRTLPSLTHDMARPEDLDTSAEDHAADEWRYACMSRPITRDADAVGGKPRFERDLSFDELRERNAKRQHNAML